MEKRAAEKKAIFASFRLGEREFAMGVAALREVVPCPARIEPLAGAPTYVRGIMRLREAMLPLVSVAEALKLEPAPASEGRVAIVEREGRLLGLLFDATAEILAVPPEDVAPFLHEKNAGLIGGALRLEGGERILPLVEPAAFFALPGLPAMAASRAGAGSGKKGPRVKCITLRAGEQRFGLPMLAIREVIQVEAIKPSVLNYEYSLGLVNLRGRVVPVIDLAKFAGLPPAASAPAGNHRIVLLSLEGQYVGFRVDLVESILSYYEEDLQPLTASAPARPELLRGLLPVEAQDGVVFLREEALLSHEEIRHLTQGHCALYRDPGEQCYRAKSAGRRSFLNFRLDSLLSIPLHAVEEIIDDTRALATPPGYPPFVRGVLQRRGEAVTVVDLRAFYGLPSRPDGAAGKVLVVRGKQGRFGLFVDEVESISHVENQEPLRIPELLHPATARAIGADLTEIAEMKDGGGAVRTFFILSPERLLARLEAPAA